MVGLTEKKVYLGGMSILSILLMSCLDPLSFYKNWFLAVASKN
jgi:hypothetical protein